MKLFPLRTTSSRKLLLITLVIAAGVALALPLSRSVGAGSIVRRPFAPETPTKGKRIALGQFQEPQKAKLFPNLDLRVTSPSDVVKIIGSGNTESVALRAQSHVLSISKGLSQLKSASAGVDAKLSVLTGAVEVLRSKTGPLTGPAFGRTGDDIVRSFISDNA